MEDRQRTPLTRVLVFALGGIALVALLAAAILCKREGFDFQLRYNEMTAVMDGTDPYLIWSGEVADARFYPYNHPEMRVRPEQLPIHAYTPWSYAYVMPFFKMFSRSGAWMAFRIAQAFALVLIAAFAYLRCKAARSNHVDGLTGVAAAFAFGLTYGVAFMHGNYSILLVALLILMIVLLNRGRDVLAGVCWAFAMSKPQCAVLMAIPLLLHRRWKTIVTAVAVCGLAALIPASICGRSPIEMILQVCKLVTGVYGGETALFPSFLANLVFGPGHMEDRGVLLPINAAVGISLCAIASWSVRKSKDWLVLLSPAIIFPMTMTYFNINDRCMFSVPAIAFTAWCLGERNRLAEMMMVAFCVVATCCCGIFPLITFDGIMGPVFSLVGQVYPRELVHDFLFRMDGVAMFVFAACVLVAYWRVTRRADAKQLLSAVLIALTAGASASFP